MVVVPLIRFETQIVTRPEPGSRSRTSANAAVADCSLPAVSICAITSRSGSIGLVIVLNGAAASSPETRASALRVTSSSIGGTSTTTSPRQCGDGSATGPAATVGAASASAMSNTVPVINLVENTRSTPVARGATICANAGSGNRGRHAGSVCRSAWLR